MAQFRLYGLLVLLVPLFAGLQLVVREGVPRVEVRFVPQDVPSAVPVVVPVEVPVERVVERVVYVAVERQESQTPDGEFEPARGNLPSAPIQRADPTGETDDSRPVVAEGGADGPAVASADDSVDVPPLAGTVAVAPPRVAPVAPRLAPVRAPVAVEAVAEEPEAGGAEPVVAMEDSPTDVSDEDMVAEAPGEDVEVVPTERVALYSSEVPMVRDDEGPSVGMLRHELFASVTKPQTAPVEAEAEAEQESTEVPVADEPEGAPAPVADGEESEQASEEPQAEVEPEAVATRTTESLLSEAPTTRADMIDPGSNNTTSIGVLEHQLIARPAKPEHVAGDQHEPEAEQASAEQDAEEVVASEASEDAGEPAVAVDEAETEHGQLPMATIVGDSEGAEADLGQ